jgi:hypothetical protein
MNFSPVQDKSIPNWNKLIRIPEKENHIFWEIPSKHSENSLGIFYLYDIILSIYLTNLIILKYFKN